MKLDVLFRMVPLALLVAVACSKPAESPAPPAEPTQPESQTVAVESQTSWEIDGLKISMLEGSPQFDTATLAINGLADGAKLPSGKVAFDFAVENYTLGEQTPNENNNGLANSAQGQHIHMILNNGPYSAHYEPAFEMELEDGHYVMLSFLSRSWHESVKPPATAVVQQFTVGEGEHEAADLSGQHLFYSRPKGSYMGDDIKKLLLDFYLVNTSISPEGNKVKATINGSQIIITKWAPYVIEGLQPGEVTISLELIDAEGNLVPGPFNSVTRTVTLEAGE